MPGSDIIDVGSIRLAVRTWSADEPAGIPLVLLPATGETAEDWDEVAAALAPTRSAYAVDLRGHGGSDRPGAYSIALMAEDVARLVPHLDGGPVDLVGHSLGGLVACRVAAAHPDLVRRLVLEDVGLLRPRQPDPPVRPDGDLPFDWGVVEQIRPEIDDPDPRWPAVLAAITAPTLVVAGGPRSPVAAEQIADLVQLVPHAEAVTLDTGHLVHATDPIGFVAAVLAFLARRGSPAS